MLCPSLPGAGTGTISLRLGQEFGEEMPSIVSGRKVYALLASVGGRILTGELLTQAENSHCYVGALPVIDREGPWRNCVLV